MAEAKTAKAVTTHQMKTLVRSGKSAYDILGVNTETTPTDVEKAYRRKCLVWHPDKWSTHSAEEQKKAEDTFKEIGLCRDILRSTVTRAIYDDMVRNLSDSSSEEEPWVRTTTFRGTPFSAAIGQGTTSSTSEAVYGVLLFLVYKGATTQATGWPTTSLALRPLWRGKPCHTTSLPRLFPATRLARGAAAIDTGPAKTSSATSPGIPQPRALLARHFWDSEEGSPDKQLPAECWVRHRTTRKAANCPRRCYGLRIPVGQYCRDAHQENAAAGSAGRPP